jgi:hypothetical protein
LVKLVVPQDDQYQLEISGERKHILDRERNAAGDTSNRCDCSSRNLV